MEVEGEEEGGRVDRVETEDVLPYYMCLQAGKRLKREGDSLGMWCP